ncbi:MAG: hypothetical protein QXE05_13115, partial [Nitrososphaeria archaeon]
MLNKNESNILELMCEFISFLFTLNISFSMLSFFLIKKVNFYSLIFALILSLLTVINYKKKYIFDNSSKLFFIMSLYYCLVLSLNLYAYPYFPIMFSIDFITHLTNSLNLIAGNCPTLPANPGVSLLLAGWLSFGFDNILLFSRIYLCFVLYSALPFIYFIGSKIRKDKGGLIASMIYSTLNPFFIYTLNVTGLYANSLGLTVALFSIFWFIKSIENLNIKNLLMLTMCGIITLLAHSSNILIYSTIFISTIYLIIIEKQNVPIRSSIFYILGLVIILIFSVETFLRLPNTLTSPFFSIEISSDTLIIYILRNFPFLKTLYIFSGENLVPVLFLLLTLLSSIICLFKRKLNYGVIPFIWLLQLLILSGFSTNIWRLCLISFTPLSLLSPIFFDNLFLPTYLKIKGSLPSISFKKMFKYQIIIFFILILFLSSLGNPVTSITNSIWSRPQQVGFYECLMWFKDNSERDSIVISIGGGTPLQFLPLVAKRTFLDRFDGQPPEFAYNVLKNYSNGYVVVWNRLHPYNGSFYYVDLYKN